MCDLPGHACDGVTRRPWSRRRFLTSIGVGAAAVAGRGLVAIPAAGAAQVSVGSFDPALFDKIEQRLRPNITPRAEWAPELLPKGAIEVEAKEDVRFLLCHHTAQPNGYSEASIERYLTDIYTFHTSPSKGWPDIAYNFLIDRFGGIWEGRVGSIEEPVKGSATGGSQGFALLCCWLGNHHEEPPSLEARASMEQLLAWLSHKYSIDTSPGAKASFVSRGSQLHRRGDQVETTTIAGHRDMSSTVCPGDFAYPAVIGEFPQAVTSIRNAVATAVAPTTTAAPTTTQQPTTTSTTSAPTTTTTAATTTTTSTIGSGVTAPSSIEDAAGVGPDDEGGFSFDWPVAAAIAAGAASVGGAMWHQQKGAANPDPPQ